MYLKQCVKNFIGTKILLVRGYHVVHHPNCGIIRNHATNKPRSRFLSDFRTQFDLILSCDKFVCSTILDRTVTIEHKKV